MIRNVDIDFNFQAYIPKPPESPAALYDRACSSDTITVSSFRDVWMTQTKANHVTHGPFAANAIGQLFGSQRLKPVIIVGSGPSLAVNVDQLKDTKGIPVISVLHNYHYLEDRGIKPDYYMTLDAGPVTIEEVSEGGTKTPEEYLESTRDKTLIAFIGSHPKLIQSWRGKIIWYSAPIPDREVMEYIEKVEDFKQFVSTGGNVLGACFYVAKSIMGANPVIFTGADFCFSYTNKFHPWDSKYDKNIGQYMNVTDVFGMPRKTWASYYQFKCWFESRVCSIPGLYINATEGGLLGAYSQGNIQQIQQMSLKDVIGMYSLSDQMGTEFLNDEILKAKERVQSPEAKARRAELERLKAEIDSIQKQMVTDQQIEERKILF